MKDKKRNCEVTETSKPMDIDKSSDNSDHFHAAKYIISPKKGFNDAIKKALEKMGYK